MIDKVEQNRRLRKNCSDKRGNNGWLILPVKTVTVDKLGGGKKKRGKKLKLNFPDKTQYL